MNPLLFTDPAFLFCFAPLVFTLYYVVPRSWQNPFLLVSSLLLYAWGEGSYVAVLLASIVINYGCGLWIGRNGKSSLRVLVLGIAANLLLLAIFKYSVFIVANMDDAIGIVAWRPFTIPKMKLPVGLSFYTFMAISYLVDIYRRRNQEEKRLVTFGTYLALFPHLIAGPIVRFNDIVEQLHHRSTSLPDVAEGIRRFVIGLGKKVLIGNTVAVTADAVFSLPREQLSTPLAWIGLICYTIQIYFDFSGYSDMAIGLARMLGFRFPENFNYPYISQSITEFWRRWHISLSTWLRDYLFFPLGTRGGGVKLARNALLVFLLCGLWHGAAWHFVMWGLFHGVFRILERTRLGSGLRLAPASVRHAYTLFVIMIGWVLFRAETIPAAGSYLAALFGIGHARLANPEITRYLPLDVLLAMLVGIVASAPLRISRPRWKWLLPLVPVAEFAALAGVFVIAVAVASAGTYHPFIYFRF
jgi:alginate O-acetyltransferase complex protein AlgI